MRSPAEIAAGMHEPQPFSNPLKFDIWAGNWCWRCEHEDWAFNTRFCPILSHMIAHAKTPSEWVPGQAVDSSEEFVCVEFSHDIRFDEDDDEEEDGPYDSASQ
ncbi:MULTISPECIES: hypothetical protein [Nocardia]|uniref:Uncharacterized protein n=1 Tax=Nocardia nova TaxID=37330 RepID=A0A2T2ZE22_9NOCA|nr:MULTISPECIES: hypothetical protein [Nocardia]PSR66017.1 hypothetical protein C8259_01260 [Nocardia nova]